jgi:hypothetical protein
MLYFTSYSNQPQPRRTSLSFVVSIASLWSKTDLMELDSLINNYETELFIKKTACRTIVEAKEHKFKNNAS